jgi:proline iminopeptidase
MPLSDEIKKMLYPASEPFHTGTLTVGGYTLPYKEYGNPGGAPIVYLHGGPGGGTPADAYRVFDPKFFHIITYDQRGAGTSTPGGGVENNTPDNLADDMEVLRQHLGIEQWHIYGGSWGSALSLLYAEKYPEKVKSLTLYGIFLLREEDDNLQFEAARTMRPEAYRKFKEFLLPGEQGDSSDDIPRMREAYYQKIMNPDPAVYRAAAAASDQFGSVLGSLEPSPRATTAADCDDRRIYCERICAAMSHNHRFKPEDRLLRDINKIRHIPTRIIQGLYDLICPPKIAQDLKEVFPEADFESVTAGHSVPDLELTRALIQATNNIRDTGSPLTKKDAPKPSAVSKTKPPAH